MRLRCSDRFPLPDWLQRSVERYVGRVPLWQFPELPPTARLTFERLDFDNSDVVLEMFAQDASLFVDAAFKDAQQLYEYVAHSRICGPYSPNHGAADWIVRKSGGPAVGLLNAYDIHRETWALNHRRCSIGYAFREADRGTGVAYEAVTALQSYLFHTFDMLMLLAYPERPNERSVRFLRRLGYSERIEDYVDRDANRYFELYRDRDAEEQMACRFEPKSGDQAGT